MCSLPILLTHSPDIYFDYMGTDGTLGNQIHPPSILARPKGRRNYGGDAIGCYESLNLADEHHEVKNSQKTVWKDGWSSHQSLGSCACQHNGLELVRRESSLSQVAVPLVAESSNPVCKNAKAFMALAKRIFSCSP